MKKTPGQESSKPSCAAGKKDEAKDIQEKMKKVDVKTTSATSLLAKNTVLLPSGVVRVKQLHEVKAVSQAGSSSGSATGEPIPSSSENIFFLYLLLSFSFCTLLRMGASYSINLLRGILAIIS